ncbi:MAG: hypothetical protein ACPG47_08330 [Leucothrix sp.]
MTKHVLAAAISAILIAGCGSDNNDTMQATPQARTVSGSAAKGIVQQGIVKAYLLDSTGTAGAVVGNATTGADGTYSLTMADTYDGVSALLLELTADADTRMVCDAKSGCGAVARGELVTPPASFKLTTVLPGVGSDTAVNAQITAFTHMAAKSIQNSGDASSANITATTSKVNGLVGVNILETAPVNITESSQLSGADENQQRYTVMLAALAEEAFKDNDASGSVDTDDMISNLEAFADDFSDGSFGGSGGLNMATFLAAVDAEVVNSAADLNDTVETSLDQHTTIVESQLSNGGYTPASVSGEGASDVARAKSLLTEVRTWNNSLADLENPAKAFTDDAEVIVDTLDQNSQAVIEVFSKAINAAAEAIDEAEETNSAVATSVAVYNGAGVAIGDIAIADTSGSNNQEYTVTATDLSGVAINLVIKLNTLISNTTVAAGDVVFEISGSAANADTKVTLNNTAVTMTLTEAYDRESDTDLGDVTSAMAFAGGIKIESLSAGAVTGQSVMGNVMIKLVALSGVQSIANDDNLSLEKIALTDLTVSDTEGSTGGLSISLEMDNATGFDTFGYLNNEPMVEVSEQRGMDTFDLNQLKTAFSIASVDYINYNVQANQTCGTGRDANGDYVNYSCQNGDVGGLKSQAMDVLNAKYPQDYVSTSVKFVNISGSFNSMVDITGSLDVGDMETASSFLDATLNITGKIDLAAHPEAMLSLTADKTGLKAGTFTATLGYDNKTLQFMATTTDGNDTGTSGDLSFSNADGVVMKLSASSGEATSGSVTVDGTTVGTIEEMSGDVVIMRYNDGTFESL